MMKAKNSNTTKIVRVSRCLRTRTVKKKRPQKNACMSTETTKKQVKCV